MAWILPLVVPALRDVGTSHMLLVPSDELMCPFLSSGGAIDHFLHIVLEIVFGLFHLSPGLPLGFLSVFE